MSRMKCKCGESLSNSNNPEIEYEVFSNEEWINVLDRIDEGEELINISGNKLEFWKCPSCKRLYFFENGNNYPIGIYKLEEGSGW